jgi:hypothetical protein
MIAKLGYDGSLFPPPPLGDGTIIADFYRSPETLSADAAQSNKVLQQTSKSKQIERRMPTHAD